MPPTQARPPADGCAALSAATYRRLNALCPTLDVAVAEPGSPPRPGWVDGATLMADTRVLDALFDAGASRIADRYGHCARPDVVATSALHGYLWSVCLLMSGPWYLQRRVPRIRASDVRVQIATGSPGVVPGPFACLPGDPAAALPGARVLSDEAALRAQLRRAVADHARALLAVFGPRVRRGPRALWGMVADDLVSGIWHLGRALGEEERAVRLAAELLPGPIPPFPAGADFRTITDAAGDSRPTRTRLGCCLHYTIRPAEACGTCPRVRDAARPTVTGPRR